MAKKRKRRESSDNKKKKRSSQSCNSNSNSNNNSNKNTNKSSNDNRKLSDFSYAELILLSSTLSYSLAEELDEDDLAIFLVFLGLLLAEMQAIVVQRSIKAKQQVGAEEDVDLADDIGLL